MGLVRGVRLWEVKGPVKSKTCNRSRRMMKLKPSWTEEEDSVSKQPSKQKNVIFEKTNKLRKDVYGLTRIHDN